ncbi:Uma2 family endonuclease [Actinocorallia sp. A-T 12471]|uniref:Uma2 family endonuclease n=1 Tax=Actinocorallia sp. A-T 12471 TaxID=3089813 RepID=UPI0029D14109|nr:Uma2 family endonuclease [Actinocorallia sp. A-T 12471]MDX6739296.1 Uma2 family endonuclease [Actinocorallia sp. A-T 12471]
MSEPYDWPSLMRVPPSVDLDMYLAMPEHIARRVEIKDGMIAFRESPSPNHITVSRTIEQALRAAVAKHPQDELSLRASGTLDMLVSEVPFSFRRPDAIVYRCVKEPRGRWKKKPTVADTLLVVEVVSPGTVTADLRDKRAEYAALGIPHYWIVRMARDDGPVASIERLRLMSDDTYTPDGISLRSHTPALTTTDPVEVHLTWEDLDEGVE